MGLDVKERNDGCQREVATSNVDQHKTCGLSVQHLELNAYFIFLQLDSRGLSYLKKKE